MYISSSYDASVYKELINNSSSTKSEKSLLDYLNDNDDRKSNGLSDTVSLSAEAYSAISERNPELLSILGYEKSDEESKMLANSSGSSLDKVELSPEAFAVLKEQNPEVLEALGYDLSESETTKDTDETA